MLLTEFLGERKLANLHKLIEHARTADQNGNDLNEFITQLTEFIAEPPKEPLASDNVAEAADVIRLMTIHHAKGLEFPFVVVPDLDRPPRRSAPMPRSMTNSAPSCAFPAMKTATKNHHRHEPVRPLPSARPNSKNANACCTSPARARPTTSFSPAASKRSTTPRAIG